MTEAQFMAQVIGFARYYGFRVFHPADNVPRKTRSGRVVKQRVVAGFPDLVLVRGVELLFVKLKVGKGRTTPEQVEWLRDLERVATAVRALTAGTRIAGETPCVETYVWRPEDFDELHERLARGRRRVEPVYRAGEAA